MNDEVSMSTRVGIGYDVHRLVKGQTLVLGGVTIPFEMGLEGHSDADVLAHAVTDALLGAAAMEDIGAHFPDSDPQWKNIDSLILLEKVVELLTAAGYSISNVDSSIAMQRPKLRPFIHQMRSKLAHALKLNIDKVSVKATTTEWLGFTGREEGVAVWATCAILKISSADD